MSNLFFCDNCNIEKFNSETQEYEFVAFECQTKHNYIRHMTTKKHLYNVIHSSNLDDDHVVECKHCTTIFTNIQYKQHKERNQLLWCMKATNPIYKDCSCNNFIFGKKRFTTINELKEYSTIKEIYTYGQKNPQIGYTRKNYDKAIQILRDKEDHEVKLMEAGKRRDIEMMEKYKEKKAKEEEAKKKLKEKKNKTKIIGTIEDEEFIHKEIQMNIVEQPEEEHVKAEQPDELEEEETPMEKKKRERNDLCIPPIFSDEDLCCNCGLYQNFIVEYEDEKLKRYNITICSCGESDVTDED